MNFFEEVKKCITLNIEEALKIAMDSGDLPRVDKYSFTVEVPKYASFGDYA